MRDAAGEHNVVARPVLKHRNYGHAGGVEPIAANGSQDVAPLVRKH